MQTPCQIAPLRCHRSPSPPCPSLPRGWLTPPCPVPPAWPCQGCATGRVSVLALPFSPGNVPRAPPQGCCWGRPRGTTTHPPPSPSSCKESQVGGERANAPLPAQPCRKPVLLCPWGQRFGPWALLGHSGCPQHRCCRASLQRSAEVQEAAVGAGHPETGQVGRQRQVGPPQPPSRRGIFIYTKWSSSVRRSASLALARAIFS